MLTSLVSAGGAQLPKFPEYPRWDQGVNLSSRYGDTFTTDEAIGVVQSIWQDFSKQVLGFIKDLADRVLEIEIQDDVMISLIEQIVPHGKLRRPCPMR